MTREQIFQELPKHKVIWGYMYGMPYINGSSSYKKDKIIDIPVKDLAGERVTNLSICGDILGQILIFIGLRITVLLGLLIKQILEI